MHFLFISLWYLDQAASDNEGGDDMVGRPQQQIKNTPEIYFSLFLLL